MQIAFFPPDNKTKRISWLILLVALLLISLGSTAGACCLAEIVCDEGAAPERIERTLYQEPLDEEFLDEEPLVEESFDKDTLDEEAFDEDARSLAKAHFNEPGSLLSCHCGICGQQQTLLLPGKEFIAAEAVPSPQRLARLHDRCYLSLIHSPPPKPPKA